jgi:predicted nucleic acid-binding protein
VTTIIDASVALKWVIEEDGFDDARRLISVDMLAAPDLLFIECANVLRTKVRRGVIKPADAHFAFSSIQAAPIRGIPIGPHAAAAHAIALELDQSAYDSLYLAVALAERASFVTADRKFASAVAAHPVYRSSVALLGG